MHALLLSTALIFVAELGDKSQLMAMTFAARYRVRDVLVGITVATAVVHLVSVGAGRLIGDQFAGSQDTISIIGSTVGMVLADALAIVVGAVLGKHLPERAIKYGAAAAFLVFGVLLVAGGL